VFLFLYATGKLKDDNTTKAYTDVTAYLGAALFMSIISSVVIALQADMPASIGYGGFIYIIGPSAFGVAVLIVYFILVNFKPGLKFLLGLAGIVLILFFGICYYSGLLP